MNRGSIFTELLSAAEFLPSRLVFPAGWIGHIPFASWIMQVQKPKIFVELGTHSGNSYFSFCQAVSDHSLPTKCFAVDTWLGDAHSGEYGEDVFQDVYSFNQENFKLFSKLIRMPFDDAFNAFRNSSIDLLHIDGLHTYEAVKHDFEQWLPKLNVGAVVLFHDTNVRDNNFGVWKLFEELKERYQKNFEFFHSHGLGVIRLDGGAENASLDWIFADGASQQKIIGYFSSLGKKIQEKYSLLDSNNRLAQFNQSIIARDTEISELRDKLIGQEKKLEALILSIEDKDTHISSLNQSILAQRQVTNEILSSNSWKFTKPFRFLSSFTGLSKKNHKKDLIPTPFKGDAKKNPHYLPPYDESNFAIPFNYKMDDEANNPSIAIICHIFYVDLASEIMDYILRVPYQFDLFITTDTEEKKNYILRELAGWKKGAVEVRLVENRGRDIAPKLISYRDVYERYEFFLHLHSKKSPHLAELSSWRRYLFETLLGSENIVRNIFDAFYADKQLGIIGPAHFDIIRNSIGWGWNFEAAKRFCKKMNINIALDGKIDFPSGSMFWGRSAALKSLLDIGLTLDEFQVEDGQLDNSLGHVIERLYYYVCERSGYRWIKIGRPKLVSYDSNIIFVEDKNTLGSLIQEAQYNLLFQRGGQFFSTISENHPNKFGHDNHLWGMAHSESELKDLKFSEFCDELKKHIASKVSKIDFDEEFYKQIYPDIAEAVKIGHLSCGYVHYCIAGKFENRIYSDQQLNARFSISPNYPHGYLAPSQSVLLRGFKNLVAMPNGAGLFLLILFSDLKEEFFYAGYAEFFKKHKLVFEKFSRIVLAVENVGYDKSLVERYTKKIEVIDIEDINKFVVCPDLIIAYNAKLVHEARKILPNRENRIVYYCQEFEAGFYPYGDAYLMGERAIASTRNLVISTQLLTNFLLNKGLINGQNIFVTKPEIEVIKLQAGKSKRIFFYYRPESFHSRNLPHEIMVAVNEFCGRNSGFEIYMIGTIDTAYSYRINGNQVYVVTKLSKEDYTEILSSCDLVVSMIYAPHPGVIAFQAAASGIPTITNIFENRDASLLKNLSDNFIPYNPVCDSLVDLIESAIEEIPKGVPSFKESLYSGGKPGSLEDYYEILLQNLKSVDA